MEIDTTEAEVGVHAAGRSYYATCAGVIEELEAEQLGRAFYRLNSAGVAVKFIEMIAGGEIEDKLFWTAGRHSHELRDIGIGDGIGIRLSSEPVERRLELGGEGRSGILTGWDTRIPDSSSLTEGERAPCGGHIIQIGGNTAVDEFDTDDVLQRATESPAKIVGVVIRTDIAVAAVDGHGDFAFFSLLPCGFRE